MTRETTRPTVVLPAGLIFLSAVWLMGSWLLAQGVHSPIHATSASYEPGVRLMLEMVAIGLVIGWPLLRLSESAGGDRPAARHPIRQTALDLAVLLAVLQLVVWLPRLLTVWSPGRTAAIMFVLAGWTLLVGAIVAASRGVDRPGPRTLAMLGCVALVVLMPAAVWFASPPGDSPPLLLRGPVLAIRPLTEGGSAPPGDADWRAVVWIWIAAGAAWLVMVPLVSRRATA